MTATMILTCITTAILIIQSATRIPAAVAELLHECQQVITAARDLKAATRQRNHRLRVDRGRGARRRDQRIRRSR